jgi:hypothetical protein
VDGSTHTLAPPTKTQSDPCQALATGQPPLPPPPSHQRTPSPPTAPSSPSPHPPSSPCYCAASSPPILTPPPPLVIVPCRAPCRSPRLRGMYKRGAAFSLELLVEAVRQARPDLLHSQEFYWVSRRGGQGASRRLGHVFVADVCVCRCVCVFFFGWGVCVFFFGGRGALMWRGRGRAAGGVPVRPSLMSKHRPTAIDSLTT